jgi:predicted PurR-regulated permease PerM
MIGSSLLGLIGGLLAVPVAAAVILILDEVVIPRANNE